MFGLGAWSFHTMAATGIGGAIKGLPGISPSARVSLPG
jgi:hypothetical protein